MSIASRVHSAPQHLISLQLLLRSCVDIITTVPPSDNSTEETRIPISVNIWNHVAILYFYNLIANQLTALVSVAHKVQTCTCSALLSLEHRLGILLLVEVVQAKPL